VETFLRHQAIVISPGVPWDLPQLQAARQAMIPVYPEVEAASWFLEGTFVGITGSNGKTTTTSLLGKMLKASGFSTFVGGNIGNALSQAVDNAPPGTMFVTELSSFQLEGIHEFRPHVAVMLNLSPNHLDRHPSLEAYAQAKQRIFRNQTAQDFAVLNADDPWVAGLQSTVASQPVFFSRTRELANGVFASGGKIHYRTRHLERVLFEARDVTLRGDFNLEDVLAATTAACLLGADFASIRKAVREFKAVEHRLEFVREIQGVEFYNNSKATSVDATLKSLEAFAHGVHLILGGKDKGAPYTPLLPLIKDRVREILVIGAAAPVIAQQLAGSADLVQAGDLFTAVTEAFAHAQPGDTVLLAPACSSFDQFRDYEERGRVFKDLVNRLATDAAGKDVREAGLGTRDSGLGPTPAEEVRPARGSRGSTSGTRSTGRGRKSGISNLESGIRASELAQSPAPEIPSPQAAAPPAEASVASPEPPPPTSVSADILSPESVVPRPEPLVPSAEPAALSTEHSVPSPDAAAAAPELQGASPESRVTNPEPRFPSPDPPHHIELRYVYEVDAEEMPGMGSQAVPGDEPEVYVLAGAAEVLDDDVLPYEARPAKAKSEVQGPDRATGILPVIGHGQDGHGTSGESGTQRGPEQPKLFNGNDKGGN
jgi:UDP-N-acetylmuramoylalanine--D-glutamate ligase